MFRLGQPHIGPVGAGVARYEHPYLPCAGRLLFALQPARQCKGEALAGEIRNSINAIVGEVPTNKKGEPEEPVGPVEAVLFTSFIVQ